MVLFLVKGKVNNYPFIVLNGNNFHYKIQEIILGKGKYRNYFTINEDIKDIEIEVIDIDIDKNKINSKLKEEYDKIEGSIFTPIKEETINKYYSKISIKQNFDFYQNLLDYYTVEKINYILYLYLYKNVTDKWLSIYFNIDLSEIHFLLNYLPIYYNYLEVSKWHTY